MPTTMLTPAIMACRAILLTYTLCPELERIDGAGPPGDGTTWLAYQRGLLTRLEAALAVVLRPTLRADGTVSPLQIDYQRALIQICLHWGLVVPGYALEHEVVVGDLKVRTLDDNAVERMSAWLAESLGNSRRRGDAGVIGSATMPGFITAVEACRRQVPAPPGGYVAWRWQWLTLDRYIDLPGRRERLAEALRVVS